MNRMTIALCIALGLALLLFFQGFKQDETHGPLSAEQSVSEPLLKTELQSPAPNIVLIYADDIDCESLFTQFPAQKNELIRFPFIRELAMTGTTFTNFHVTTPVCGPSRACLFSGQYAHHNQCRVNSPQSRSSNGFSGGYQLFDDDQEMGNWMQQAGYKTGYVGKYMHDGFSPNASNVDNWKAMKPSGWDHFMISLGAEYLDFWRTDCETQEAQKCSKVYRTDAEVESVLTMLDAHNGDSSGQPLFLCWAPIAAHIPLHVNQMTAERHKGLFANEIPSGVTDVESYRFIANKPSEPDKCPQVNKAIQSRWINLHQKRLRSIQALDEGLGKIREQLRKNGQLKNTIFVFTSDHGFSLGQHRHFAKRMPLDRITRVPFIVSGPGIAANQYCDQLLANIDIAPTLVDFSGGKVHEKVDGVSFANLMRAPDAELTAPRNEIIIENWERVVSSGVPLNLTYSSLRTQNHIYTQWAMGGFEYYNLDADPEQVDNLYPKLDENSKESLARQLKKAHKHPAPPVFSSQFDIQQEYLIDPVGAYFEPVEFSGFAEDDSGIESVEVEMRCTNDGTYWNGAKWCEQPTTVLATLGSPGGNVTYWSYKIDTSGMVFPKNRPRKERERDVLINLIATDADGVKTRWETACQSKMDPSIPETWIDSPRQWTDRSQPLKIFGRAADNESLDRVEIVVLDTDRKLYWNGKQWNKERTLVPAKIEMITNKDQPGSWGSWTYEFDGIQKGQLYISARAHDNLGLADSTVSYFSVPLPKTQAP